MTYEMVPESFSIESTKNSSTTALSGAATFTGEAERNGLSDVMVSCQASADGTLYFDFSNDGDNWLTFPVNGFQVSAGIHEFHTAVKGPRWFRVRLVNGAAAQTYLRLYTYFGTFRQGTDASDGRTPVSLGVSGLDCNRIELTGDGQANAGNIYVQQGNAFTIGVPDDLTIVLAFVRAGYGQTEQAIYTVPAGYEMRMKRLVLTLARSLGAAGSAIIQLMVKKTGQSWVVKREWNFQNGEFTKPLAGLVLPAGTQVKMRLVSTSDNGNNLTAEWHYDLAAVVS